MKNWPNDINETVKNLNEQLKIDHNDWHKFKGNKNRLTITNNKDIRANAKNKDGKIVYKSKGAT